MKKNQGKHLRHMALTIAQELNTKWLQQACRNFMNNIYISEKGQEIVRCMH